MIRSTRGRSRAARWLAVAVVLAGLGFSAFIGWSLWGGPFVGLSPTLAQAARLGAIAFGATLGTMIFVVSVAVAQRSPRYPRTTLRPV